MANPTKKLDAYTQKLVDQQNAKVKLALASVKKTNLTRYLLAVRGYVKFSRYSGPIDSRWVYTEAEYATFRSTSTHTIMQSDIKKIRNQFARDNRNVGPDKKKYTISNIGYRDLSTQLNFWKTNATVKNLGKILKRLTKRELARKVNGVSVYPDVPTDESVAQYRTWLSTESIPGLSYIKKHTKDNGVAVTMRVNTPSVATPGLSDHGRVRAIDFVVKHKGKRLTKPSTSRMSLNIWRGDPNWEEKLKLAVKKAGNGRWDGPLKNPDEPWHYKFIG